MIQVKMIELSPLSECQNLDGKFTQYTRENITSAMPFNAVICLLKIYVD